jgi:hypothetical protein
MLWLGCSDQSFSESLLFFVFGTALSHLIDWIGVGLIVSWSGKREEDSTKGPSSIFFSVKENTCNQKDCQLFLLLLFENHNDFVSVLRF